MHNNVNDHKVICWLFILLSRGDHGNKELHMSDSMLYLLQQPYFATINVSIRVTLLFLYFLDT
jgi:hypothetical protein